MAVIPTIAEIYSNLSSDLRNRLEISDDGLRKVLDAIAISLAGQFKLTYLSLADIQNNVFPDTADLGENGGTLDRFGLIHLNRIRRPSTSGIFTVSLIAEAGSVLRRGITFKSNDDSQNAGKLFVLDQQETLVGVADILEIRSLEGGSESLLTIGDKLTITEPVIGVDQIVTIASIVRQPFDEESIEDFRASILQSIQLEPQGGAKTDYKLWAADAQGVRKVYPYLSDNNAGTVQIYVEATIGDSTDALGTPSATLLNDVLEVIEFDPDISLPLNERGRRPIQADVQVESIVLTPVDITITGMQENSASITQSLRDNIEKYLYDIRPYVSGADLARNKNDILYSAALQSVTTNVLEASNFFTNFTVFVSGVNQLSFLFTRENIPYLRNISFN